MKRISKIQVFAAIMLVCFCAPAANAQIGSGWTAYSPSFNVQLEGCGANSGLVFKLTCSSTSGFQRAERRYEDIKSSQSQFQGTVTVNSLTGDRISLKQTFQDGIGPWNPCQGTASSRAVSACKITIPCCRRHARSEAERTEQMFSAASSVVP